MRRKPALKQLSLCFREDRYVFGASTGSDAGLWSVNGGAYGLGDYTFDGDARRSRAPLEIRSLATHSPSVAAGVSRVASVSIWTMASPSGATTWAYMRHLLSVGRAWAPTG